MLNIRILYFTKLLLHLVWPVQNKISFHFQVRNSEIVNVGIFLVAGYWILDAGCWMLDAGYWILVAGYWLLDTGYWLLVTACPTASVRRGYWLLDDGYLVLFTCHCLLPIAYLLLVTFCLILATGYCLLPTGYCLLPDSEFSPLFSLRSGGGLNRNHLWLFNFIFRPGWLFKLYDIQALSYKF